MTALAPTARYPLVKQKGTPSSSVQPPVENRRPELGFVIANVAVRRWVEMRDPLQQVGECDAFHRFVLVSSLNRRGA